MRRTSRAWWLALLVSQLAVAKEVARDDSGGVLELSGFYKSLLSGLLLQPDAVAAARTQQQLLKDAGLPSTAVPDGGFLNAHIFRLTSRFKFSDRVELEGAWQFQLSLASDPAFSGGSSLSSTIGGTNTGAQRRLIELGGPLYVGSSWRADHQLDRLALKVALPFGDLTIGRQVLSWGTGRLWNPTDVLSPFPPTVIDREVRRGFDAVRLAVALGDTTQLDLLYLPQVVAADNGGVARFQTNLWGFDFSVSAGKYVRDLVFGADFVGDVGPIGVHGEGAYTVQLLGLEAGNVSVGEHFFRGVVGAEARPHEKVLLVAEYSYNGYGSTRPQDYAALLSSARVLRGEIFGAGRHQAGLAASFLATDLFTAQLSALMNLTDPSALIIPSVEYSVSQTVLLRAGAYVPVGRPPDAHVYDGFTAADLQSAAFQQAVASRGLRSEYGASSFGAFVQVGLYVP